MLRRDEGCAWHGKEDVRVDEVPDPRIEEPTDANVCITSTVDDIIPLLTDEDPLAVADLTTHEVPLDEAPDHYKLFHEKRDGCIKVVLKP